MNLDDLTRRGLYLSDIPLHDATRDLVLLGEQFREEYKLTQELEILTDRLQHTLRALEDEKKKTDRSVFQHTTFKRYLNVLIIIQRTQWC